MATDPSILAWSISWTEEHGGLQSIGSQRVGHDRVTFSFTSTLSTRHSFSSGHTFESGSQNSALVSSPCLSLRGIPW